MELHSDAFDQAQRLIDYIVILRDGYEQLESELAIAFDRIAALEDAVSALGGRRFGAEGEAND